MSEQEKSGGGAGSSVVLVDQSAVIRQTKKPFRSIDMQENATHDLHHKRSVAPAVPAAAEEINESKIKNEPRRDTSEKLKQPVTKKQRRDTSPDKLSVLPQTGEPKTPLAITPPPPPILPQVIIKQASEHSTEIVHEETKKADNDSITGEIMELRHKHELHRASEWSDEEEAGGLPRSESRSSRVLGAVRQLFCCGSAVDPPSEHRISPRSYYTGI